MKQLARRSRRMTKVVVWACLLAIIPFTVAGADNPWPMFGHDPQHTGRSPYRGPYEGKLRWKVDVGFVIYSTPAIAADGTIYVRGSKGGVSGECRLVAIDAGGTIKWDLDMGTYLATQSSSAPAIDKDGVIYVGGGGDRQLHAITPAGSSKWTYKADGAVSSSPIIFGDRIYFGSFDYYLYVLDKEGELIWRYKTLASITRTPAVDTEGTVYTPSSCYLYATTKWGWPKWRFNGSTYTLSSSPAIDEDRAVVYVGSFDNHVYAVNLDDGTLKWKFKCSDSIYATPAIGPDGTVYICDDDYWLRALNPEDGTEKWKTVVGRMVFASPTVDADGVVYASGANLYALNPEDGSLKWEYNLQGGYCTPAIGSDRRIICGGLDKHLHAITASPIKYFSPNPNPGTSKVMAGGTFYRYYQTVDEDGNLLPKAEANIEYTVDGLTSTKTVTSDDNAMLTVQMESVLIGKPGKAASCAITAIDGKEIYPISFDVEVLTRQTDETFKFGSGVNLSAAAGIGMLFGGERGTVYKLSSTVASQPAAGTLGFVDLDELLKNGNSVKCRIETSNELELASIQAVGLGVGIKNLASVGVDESFKIEAALLSAMLGYEFDQAYVSDTQDIIRSAQILDSLSDSLSMTPLVNILLSFASDSYDYRPYLAEQKIGLGQYDDNFTVAAGGEFGLGYEDNTLLGIEIGGDINYETQIDLTRQYLWQYSTTEKELQLASEVGGMSFQSELDASGPYAVKLAGDSIGGHIGKFIGKVEFLIYKDKNGNITKGELILQDQKNWGMQLDGTTAPNDTGTTKTFRLIFEGQLLADLIHDIEYIFDKIYEHYKDHLDKKIILYETTIIDELTDIFYFLDTHNVPYQVEKEYGNYFSFSPSVYIATIKAKIEGGVSIAMERTIGSLIEEGVISGADGRAYILTKYYDDDVYRVFPALSFQEIFASAVLELFEAAFNAGVFAIGEAVEAGANTVIGYVTGKDQKDQKDETARSSASLVGAGATTATRAEAVDSGEATFAINGIFGFAPDGLGIEEISAEIGTKTVVSVAEASITIEPGKADAVLTITYADEDVTGLDEAELFLFAWHNANLEWRPVVSSQVDIEANVVTGAISKLGQFALGVPEPAGDIQLLVSPKDIPRAGDNTISVVSKPILLTTGNEVPDNTLITVASVNKMSLDQSAFGTITADDADPSLEGLQVKSLDGRIAFEIDPPDTSGFGLITARSVAGSAAGKAEFRVLENPDEDGNGLPDRWERVYFRDTGQDPKQDYDSDGLTNRQEYESDTHPKLADTDADLMPDRWEVDHALDPRFNDARRDPDFDSYSNLHEWRGGSNPLDSLSLPWIKGDVTDDSVVDLRDLIHIMFILNNQPAPAFPNPRSDVNGDGVLGQEDAIYILQKLSGNRP